MSTDTQKLVKTLFTVQFAKGDTVFFPKDLEAIEVATTSGEEVASIVSAGEIVRVGHDALAEELHAVGISIEAASPPAVRLVNENVIVYSRLAVKGGHRAQIAAIISKVNQSAIV